MSTTAPGLSLTNTALLAGIAGFVDTATFVALHGVFAAHVTGNFVLIGAALALGTGGLIAKLATFPVFMISVVLTRHMARRWERPARKLLTAKLVLLAAFWLGTCYFGPFEQADSPELILVASLAVAAMAVQNGMMRIAFPSATPTTIMTGNTTGAMIDTADWMVGRLAPEGLGRLRRVGLVLLGFAGGCAAGAAALTWVGPMGLVLPVLATVWLLFRLP
ncbi:YoaK family protein [Roseococcus sp. YIM B11640]|uniref:YoaK family protein n=1 Tax=Roseococcus sp. YIM B11640 TaxID=3133973 RepID=UPI003C7A2086